MAKLDQKNMQSFKKSNQTWEGKLPTAWCARLAGIILIAIAFISLVF